MIAMGSYDFTCATTGNVATVEYIFGYKRSKDGKSRIFLHRSSIPYSTAPATNAITKSEVKELQSTCEGDVPCTCEGVGAPLPRLARGGHVLLRRRGRARAASQSTAAEAGRRSCSRITRSS